MAGRPTPGEIASGEIAADTMAPGGTMSGKADAGFPPSARVRAKSEFSRVFEQGRRTGTGLLTLHYLADARPARLGLAVSRKVDARAVGRNRIKRRLRDYFRRRRAVLAPGAYVVVVRHNAATACGPELLTAFEQALKRSGALPANAPPCTMPTASSSPTLASAPNVSAPPHSSPSADA